MVLSRGGRVVEQDILFKHSPWSLAGRENAGRDAVILTGHSEICNIDMSKAHKEVQLQEKCDIMQMKSSEHSVDQYNSYIFVVV